jgi:glycogen debranching enzyme
MVHLAAVELHLMRENSIGLKTLDPAASEYVHFYDNADQSNIFNVSHGFSYHNGPEWVWVYGYFIKALVNIHGKEHINK